MRRLLPYLAAAAFWGTPATAQTLTRVANVPLTGIPFGIAVAGTRAYVANYGTNSLQIFDVHIPPAPVSLSDTHLTGQLRARSVVVAGSTAYVLGIPSSAQYMSQVTAYDVSTPAAPVMRGTFTYTAATLAPTPTLAANTSLVCVGGTPNGTVKVFDSSLNLLSTITEFADNLSFNGNLLYIQSAGFLSIYDLSTPTAPVRRAYVAARISRVNGTRAYGLQPSSATTSGTLFVYDVSNGLAPVLQGSVATNGAMFLTVSGNTVFTGSNYAILGPNIALQAFDVSTPAAPVLRATAGGQSSDSAGELSADANNSVYVVNNSTLQVYTYNPTITSTRPAAQATLAVYPNPARNLLYLPQTPAGTPVIVSDLTGRICLTSPLAADGSLPVGTLPAGLYLLRAGQATQKLVIE